MPSSEKPCCVDPGQSSSKGEEVEDQPTEKTPAIETVVTRDVIESVIRNHDANLEVLDFSAELGSQIGDNYMSIIYSSTVQVRCKKSRASRSIQIMLKTLPKNPHRRDMLTEMRAFEKEGRMYTEVFKDFEHFQMSKGIPEEEIFRPYPTCFSWYSDGKADYLAMEDLRPAGFRMGNRVSGLDLSHCETVIRNFAKFHAISYAMFGGDFKMIMETYPFLEERMFREPHEVDVAYRKYTQHTFSCEADILRQQGHLEESEAVRNVYDDDFYGRLRRFCANAVPNAVINHGDGWTNNLLFKYEQNSKKPSQFRFIDFQISRVGSRAIDLHYFLYSSPQMEILNGHEENLLRLYHQEFTAFAARLGYVSERLSFENLLGEINRDRPFGVALGLMLAPVFSANKADIPDMEKINVEDRDENCELAQAFITTSMQSGPALQRILNIARNHLPRCDIWKKPNTTV